MVDDTNWYRDALTSTKKAIHTTKNTADYILVNIYVKRLTLALALVLN